MQLQAGDTFFAPWPERDDPIEHLFFVISDPKLDRERVVVVPLMTWDEYKDQTCVLETGEHPFVRHRSYIDYGCGDLVKARNVERQLEQKEFRAHKPASAKLLARIREGAERSDFLALGLRDVLEEQELVDPL